MKFSLVSRVRVHTLSLVRRLSLAVRGLGAVAAFASDMPSPPQADSTCDRPTAAVVARETRKKSLRCAMNGIPGA
ncbi:hypothetical protein GCM10007242_14560 [Pigmentiphaga litoralis]|nr:hypothetical protein GCM10007242_14560 [Pigmentiphaga litoralis]